MTLGRWTLRRALVALLGLSSAATVAAALLAIWTSPTRAVLEAYAPDDLQPAALGAHIDALLAETVDAEWLAREMAAALEADPPDWARIEALDALAGERSLVLPPAITTRLEAAKAARPGSLRKCWDGMVLSELPDDRVSVGCYFGVAVTPAGDVRDLFSEGGRYMRGEEVDEFIVVLAGLGLSTTIAPPAQTARPAVAILRAAYRLGFLSTGLIAEIVARGARIVRFDKWLSPWRWVDVDAAEGLLRPLADLGRVALDAGPVAAARGLRHVDTLDAAARLRRISTATGGRPGPALEALGMRRRSPVSRISKLRLELRRLGGWLAAQLGLLALALGKAGLARLLRRAKD